MSSELTIQETLHEVRELVSSRQFEAGIAALEKALLDHDQSVELHDAMATTTFLAEKFDLAIRHFQRVVELNPRDTRAMVNLGAVFNRTRAYQKAVDILRRAIARQQGSAEAFYNLGISYRGLNQLSLAISAYREAIKLAPGMAHAYHNMGNVHRDMGNLKAAIDCYERAVEVRPDFAKALASLKAVREDQLKKSDLQSPFGRLVDPSRLKAKKKIRSHLREVTDQERVLDCDALKDISRRIEADARGLLQFVSKDLENVVMAVTRLAVGGQHTHPDWAAQARKLSESREMLNDLCNVLRKSTLTLRAHEELMNTPEISIAP